MDSIRRLAARGTRTVVLIGGAAVGLATGATAQVPISPDRPGLDFSPLTVGLGGTADGFTFLLGPDVQLDLYIDRGVNSETPDWQFGAGAAFRL